MASLMDTRRIGWLARLILLVLMVYAFLAAIELFKNAIGMIGQGAADRLFGGLENPFAGLAVGILVTALMQSSSVTTSMVVALVGSGELELQHAVPIVMGANVGTSITCALVSLGHITRRAEFRRAFAGATAHDVFNLLSVAVLFPLELATGYLRHGAQWLVRALPLQAVGGEFHSPVKTAVVWLARSIQAWVQRGLGLQEGVALAGVLAVLAAAMIVAALVVITKNMRVLMADRIEQWLNRVLSRSGLLGLAIGAVITAAVQSSSITTSLLVPMFGSGVLTLEAGFPIMLGANIGTTITALLASTVTGPAGLTIALVHLLFNVSGTLIFFPLKPVRRIPIRLSEKLADLAVRNWIWIVVYVVGVFIVVPLAGILIWR
ncbi:MAG TPA: Na/Pi symporter [Thermoguttaceae bacterium]|nr:Na/Pi symporter [Thermoguttaceae bacterium]